MQVPVELLEQILATLIPFELARLRHVSRLFAAVIDGETFATTNLRQFIASISGTECQAWDRLWFAMPPNYQRAYANLFLSTRVAVLWPGAALGFPARGSQPTVGGTLPAAIGICHALTHLNLNNATGLDGSTIPREVGALMSLQHLCLAGLGLEDCIPPEIGNLIQLKELDLSHNRLCGGIPAFGTLLKLTSLNLRNNCLTGPIPKELGNLILLRKLNLANNYLRGEVPEEVTRLPSLLCVFLGNGGLRRGLPVLMNAWPIAFASQT